MGIGIKYRLLSLHRLGAVGASCSDLEAYIQVFIADMPL